MSFYDINRAIDLITTVTDDLEYYSRIFRKSKIEELSKIFAADARILEQAKTIISNDIKNHKEIIEKK